MKKREEEILEYIVKYFKKHNACKGLIQFGSSVSSQRYHDIDILCYVKELNPDSHKKILKAIYSIKKIFPDSSFAYGEVKIQPYKKSKYFFSFVSFGPLLVKEYHVLRYSILKEYKHLFGFNPIVDVRKPSKKECMDYLVLMHNLFSKNTYIRLKSLLRNSLMVKGVYVKTEDLLNNFKKTYDIQISTNLEEAFKHKISTPTNTEKEILKIYKMILKSNGYKNKKIRELGEITPIVAFRIKVFDQIKDMILNNKSINDISSYLDEKQEEYIKKFK